MRTDVQFTAEEQEFLTAYREECEKELERFKKLEDPDDPIKLFFTRDWDYERMEALEERFHHYIRGIKGIKPEYRDVFTYGLIPITSEFQTKMQEHFKEAGFARDRIPPAPNIDHETPHKIKYWRPAIQHVPGRYSRENYEEMVQYEPIIMVGQVLIQTSLFRGEREYKFCSAYDGMLFPQKISTTGSREAKEELKQQALKIASELSKITNYEGVMDLPWKVKRAVIERVKEVE